MAEIGCRRRGRGRVDWREVVMRRSAAFRSFLVVLAVGVFTAGGVALAAGGKRRHRGLSLARVTHDQAGAPARVIVLLRNQHANLPPSAKRLGQRLALLQQDQSPLKASVARSGGRVTRSYRTVNAFAATVSRAERSRLASDSAVAKVLPDTFIPKPTPDRGIVTPPLRPRGATPAAPTAGA